MLSIVRLKSWSIEENLEAKREKFPNQDPFPGYRKRQSMFQNP